MNSDEISSLVTKLVATLLGTYAGAAGATGAQDLMGATLWPGLSNDGTTGQRFFFLESGDTLQVSFTTVITAAKEIDVVAPQDHCGFLGALPGHLRTARHAAFIMVVMISS